VFYAIGPGVQAPPPKPDPAAGQAPVAITITEADDVEADAVDDGGAAAATAGAAPRKTKKKAKKKKKAPRLADVPETETDPVVPPTPAELEAGSRHSGSVGSVRDGVRQLSASLRNLSGSMPRVDDVVSGMKRSTTRFFGTAPAEELPPDQQWQASSFFERKDVARLPPSPSSLDRATHRVARSLHESTHSLADASRTVTEAVGLNAVGKAVRRSLGEPGPSARVGPYGINAGARHARSRTRRADPTLAQPRQRGRRDRGDGNAAGSRRRHWVACRQE